MPSKFDSPEITRLMLEAVAEASARTGKPEEKINFVDFSDDYKKAIENQASNEDYQRSLEFEKAWAEGVTFRSKLFVIVALLAGIASIVIADGQAIYIIFGVGLIIASIIGFFSYFTKTKR